MAKKNRDFPFPTPVMGVRKDLSEYQVPPQGCRYAENVIVQNGSLRPRPANQDLGYVSPGIDTELEFKKVHREAFTDSRPLYYFRPCFNSRRSEFIVDGHENLWIVSDNDPSTWVDTGVARFSGNLSYHDQTPMLHLHLAGYLAQARNDTATDSQCFIELAPDSWPGFGAWTTKTVAYPATGLGGSPVYLDIMPDGSIWLLLEDSTNYDTLWIGSNDWLNDEEPTWTDMSPDPGVEKIDVMRTWWTYANGAAWLLRVHSVPSYLDSQMFRLQPDGSGMEEMEIPFESASPSEATTWMFDQGRAGELVAVVKYASGGDPYTLRIYDEDEDEWTSTPISFGPTAEVPRTAVYDAVRDVLVMASDAYLYFSYDNGQSVTSKALSTYELANYETSDYAYVAMGDRQILLYGWETGDDALLGVALWPRTYPRPLAMVQIEADFRSGAVISTTEAQWRLLEPDGSWTVLTQPEEADADPLTEYPLAGYYDRTVFRTFPKGGKTYLVGANKAQGVRSWDTTLLNGAYRDVVLEASAPNCRAIMVLANRMLALNGPDGSPAGVDTSDFNDFQNGWGRVQVSLIGDSSEPIVGGWETTALEGSIFKEDAVYAVMAQVEFGGVAAPFRFEARKVGINGPPSPASVIRMTDGSLVYLGVDGGIYRWDGMQIQEFAPQARYILADQLDFQKKKAIWGMMDPVRQIATWFYPGPDGQLNRGVMVDVANGSCWEYVLPSGWSAECGGPVFIYRDVTIGELTRKLGEYNFPLAELRTERRVQLLALADDRWGAQRWVTAEDDDYLDYSEPITVAWSPGWNPLDKSYKQYATMHTMTHILHSFGTASIDVIPKATERGLVVKEGPTATISQDSYRHDVRLSGRLFTFEASGEVGNEFFHDGVLAEFSHRGER